MRVLSINEVLDRLGISRTTFYAGVKSGQYPRPIEISAGRVGLPDVEVDSIIEQKMKQRDQKQTERAA